MANIPLFIGFHTSKRWLFGISEPSTVLQCLGVGVILTAGSIKNSIRPIRGFSDPKSNHDRNRSCFLMCDRTNDSIA